MPDDEAIQPADDGKPRPPRRPGRPSSKRTLGLASTGSFRWSCARYLASWLDELRGLDREVRRGDADGVHDQRAATRRIRVGLNLFRQSADGRRLRDLNRGERRLGRRLGAVRDMDVLLEEVHSAARDVADAELNGFMATMEERRAAARVELLQYLDGEDHRRWLSRFDALLAAEVGDRDEPEGPGPAEPDLSPSGSIRPTRVRDVLPALVWDRYGRVSAYQAAIARASTETLHGLRRDGRRLRYTLETFRELFGENVLPVLQPLREMQDALGELHDADELVRSLLEFERDAGPSDRVQPLITEERGRALEARAAFETVWPRIVDRGFRSRLAALMADL